MYLISYLIYVLVIGPRLSQFFPSMTDNDYESHMLTLRLQKRRTTTKNWSNKVVQSDVPTSDILFDRLVGGTDITLPQTHTLLVT